MSFVGAGLAGFKGRNGSFSRIDSNLDAGTIGILKALCSFYFIEVSEHAIARGPPPSVWPIYSGQHTNHDGNFGCCGAPNLVEAHIALAAIRMPGDF